MGTGGEGQQPWQSEIHHNPITGDDRLLCCSSGLGSSGPCVSFLPFWQWQKVPVHPVIGGMERNHSGIQTERCSGFGLVHRSSLT